MKQKIDKLDNIKINSFYLLKETFGWKNASHKMEEVTGNINI